MGADDTGCVSESSSNVAQERIRTNYWVLYDAESDQTFARAQFKLGGEAGTRLILEAPAGVTFEGRPMGFNEVLDWHEVVVPGRVDGGLFEYTDVDGVVLENVAPPFSVTDLPADLPATLCVDESFEFVWQGDPLVDDELMEVVVARAENRFDFASFLERSIGAVSLVLDRTGLDNVGVGNGVIGLRRHTDFALQEGTEVGGKMTTTWQPVEANVQLQVCNAGE